MTTYKLQRPNVAFVVTVSPVYVVHSCAAKLAEEKRGIFGCHSWHPNSFKPCQECKVTFRGYELWGDNGHCQGEAKDRKDLAWLLRHLAGKRWPADAGGLMGFRFKRSRGSIYYQGN